MFYTIPEIERKVKEIAKIIKAPKNLLPTYSVSQGDARPCIDIDKDTKMRYFISERGIEYTSLSTNNIDDILRWTFEDVTFDMACKFELQNRNQNQDCRRIIFKKQEELLGLISLEWKELKIIEHNEILRNNPFND